MSEIDATDITQVITDRIMTRIIGTPGVAKEPNGEGGTRLSGHYNRFFEAIRAQLTEELVDANEKQERTERALKTFEEAERAAHDPNKIQVRAPGKRYDKHQMKNYKKNTSGRGTRSTNRKKSR